MKCICVTGAIQSDLELISTLLQQAGMKRPQPADRGESIDITTWHDQALTLETETAEESSPVINLGRFMDQMASDIFVANIKANPWGWADTRSTWLLDYWVNFDPRLYFVLVYVTPQQMLANVMNTSTEAVSVDAIMATWQAHYQQLLRFHLRNPQRSILVDANECAENPQGFINCCSKQWALQMPASPLTLNAIDFAQDPLALYLAQQLCENYSDVASLQHEITASITRLDASDRLATNAIPLSSEHLINSYRALQDRSAELQQLQNAQLQLTEISRENELLLIHSHQIQAELETVNLANNNALQQIDVLQNERVVLISQYDETVFNYNQQQKEAEQENELRLQQLNQVQEELKAYFLKNEATQNLNNALQIEVEILIQEKSQLCELRDNLSNEAISLTQARDELNQISIERQAWIVALTEELDNFTEQAQIRQAEIESLIQINATLTQEKTAAEEACNVLSNECATLTTSYQGQLTLTNEHQVKIDQLTHQHNETINALTLQQKEVEQENELLLQQLHHVQEELEVYFLKNESTQNKLNDLQAEIASLSKARDHQTQLANERQTQLNALIQERKNLANQAQAEIASLSKARDHQTQLATERQTQLNALVQERENLANQAKDLQEKITPLSQAESQLKISQQDNELLQLQLHQVHEELEHYFLQHQEKQKALQTSEARWQRMLQRNPDYCDYASIEALPEENEQGTSVIWHLKNLNLAGRSFLDLTFKTILEQGMAGFVFTQQTDNTNSLIRWPANVSNEDELTIIPSGNNELLPQRIETLLELACSDWLLIDGLTRLLETALKQPQTLGLSAEFNSEPLSLGLKTLREVFAKFPPLLRYDQVTLKREQINPDYEHLCLHFDNLAFGEKQWPEFEFRLSCANVRPQHFGAYPKLEFPEATGKRVLEEWYEESYDDFGAKLELRFALPDAMDVGVWQRLSEADRSFLVALIGRLPVILKALQKADIRLRRSWEDWLNMIQDVQRIVDQQRAPQVLAANKPEPIKAKETAPVVVEKQTAPVKAKSVPTKPKAVSLGTSKTVKTTKTHKSK